jgi:hypothetical protein
VKRKTYFLNSHPLEDSTDESDDPDLIAPKQSPMRRKEKFRTKNFKIEPKHKDRRRNYRSSIRYDFELKEE